MNLKRCFFEEAVNEGCPITFYLPDSDRWIANADVIEIYEDGAIVKSTIIGPGTVESWVQLVLWDDVLDISYRASAIQMEPQPMVSDGGDGIDEIAI